jgi:hypothetical protein
MNKQITPASIADIGRFSIKVILFHEYELRAKTIYLFLPLHLISECAKRRRQVVNISGSYCVHPGLDSRTYGAGNID